MEISSVVEAVVDRAGRALSKYGVDISTEELEDITELIERIVSEHVEGDSV